MAGFDGVETRLKFLPLKEIFLNNEQKSFFLLVFNIAKSDAKEASL